MSENQQPFEFEIPIEPDLEGEEELNDMLINNELITDQSIGESRIVGSIACVEYGSVKGKPGALLILMFNYHLFKTVFRDGTVQVTLSGAAAANNPSIRHIIPKCMIWEVSEGMDMTIALKGGL
jgi:hypothetical protein